MARRASPAPALALLISLVVAGLVVTGVAAPGAAQADAPPAGAEADAVETLAGPGFCQQGATVVDEDAALGALAVDDAGRLFFDTGPPAQGQLANVDASGADSRLMNTGAPRRLPSSEADGQDTNPPAASRLAADGEGGVFVAAGASVVHADPGERPADPRVGPDPSLATVAGDPASPAGRPGEASTGDGGPAEQATFASARSVATDEAGALYVADRQESGAVAIRLLNRTDEPLTLYSGTPHEVTVAAGHLDTIAGGGGAGNTGDGGPAREAGVAGTPPALAAVGDRLYLATRYAPAAVENAAEADGAGQAGEASEGGSAVVRVRLVNLSGEAMTAHGVTVDAGVIATVAGGQSAGDTGDDGPAVGARFGRLPGIAADADGNLYLADHDHHRIRRVGPEGRVTTIAGTNQGAGDSGGFDGNDQPAVDARLDSPYDVATGPAGAVYVTDRGNEQVRVIHQQGRIDLARGNRSRWWRCATSSGSDGEAASGPGPQPGFPPRVASGHAGAVYLLAGHPRRIFRRPFGRDRIAPLSGHLDALACPGDTDEVDCPAASDLSADGDAGEPHDLAATGDGELYVLRDDGSVEVLNVGRDPLTAHGATVEPGRRRTVLPADELRLEDSGESSEGAGPAEGGPRLAVDDTGHLFVTNPATGQIHHLDPAGEATTVLDDGDTGECCTAPVDVAAADGNVYVYDEETPHVWLFNRTNEPLTAHGQTVPAGELRSIAGDGTYGIAPEQGASALDQPLPPATIISAGPRGNLYLATQRHDIHRIDAEGAITTLAGVGRGGFNGDGLLPGLTSLHTPTDLAADHCGNLVVADSFNDRVRRVNLAEPCDPPPPATAANSPTPTWPGAGAAWGGLALAAFVALVAVAGGLTWRARRRPRP